MNQILILLTFIVFARGYLNLNEQFLVAICFIAFLYISYQKFGDTVYTTLQYKADKLKADHLEYINNHQQTLNKLITQLNGNIALYAQLSSLNNFFSEQFEYYINLRETDMKNHIHYTMLSHLDSLAQKEFNFRLNLEIDLIRKFLQVLESISYNNGSDTEIPQLTLPLDLIDSI